MKNFRTLFHIAEAARFEAAGRSGIYEPELYPLEGFIHCSFIEQVVPVANRLFKGQRNLVLLEFECAQLEAPVKLENLEGGEELFPHLYGVLPVSAISTVHEFDCDTHGEFSLPVALSR